MGTVDKTIEIIFAGTDKVSGIISDISGDLDTMGSAMEDVGAPFAAATKQVAILQAAIAGIGAAALAAAAKVDSEGIKMQAALGLSTDEAEKFKSIAADAYSRGYADDLASSFDAVILAQRKFGDNADVDITKVIESASKLHKAFEIDISSALGATNTLMSNFGLTSEQAFDFVAAGYRKGLDGSGDFIESINEYSTQFANGGADAGNFFSILETGFQEGMLGTDRAADAFKEFRVRIQDDSTLTRKSLELIGIDPDLLASNLQNGVLTVNDAFGQIIKKLNETDDASIVMQAGVGFMGTQFEDLGTIAALALDTTKTKMEDLEGLVRDIDVDDFGVLLTRAWRTALQKLTDHPMWDDLQDSVSGTALLVSESFVEAFGQFDFSEILANFGELAEEIGSIFVENEIDLTTVDGMKNAIQLVIDTINSLIDVTKGQVEALKPIIAVILDMAKGFNDLDSDTKELIGNILTIGTALGTLGGVVVAGGALLTGLKGLALAMTGPVGLVIAAAAVGSGIYTLVKGMNDLKLDSDLFEENLAVINEFADAIGNFPEVVQSRLDIALQEGASTDEIRNIINEGLLEQDYESNVLFTQEGLDELVNGVEEVTEEDKVITINIDGVDVALEDTAAIHRAFAALEEKSKLRIDVDTEEVEAATQVISIFVGELGNQTEMKITVPIDSINDAKKEIETIPTEKMLEIELQGNIDLQVAQIKASADTAQASFKYKAEVDIAEAKAQADILAAAYDSISATIQSTGEVISDSIKIATDPNISQLAQNKAERLLRDEAELRQKAFDLQERLTNAQIDLIEAKQKAIDDGDGLINIDSSGLEPALEMIMWQIIEKVQIRASAEASEFLLGI